jgi:hypothetical protein
VLGEGKRALDVELIDLGVVVVELGERQVLSTRAR